MADDVTSESRRLLARRAGGRLAVLLAEGGIFTTLAGRYTGGVPSLYVSSKATPATCSVSTARAAPPSTSSNRHSPETHSSYEPKTETAHEVGRALLAVGETGVVNRIADGSS